MKRSIKEKEKYNKNLRKDLEVDDLLKDLFGLTMGGGEHFYPVNTEKFLKSMRDLISS